MFLPTSIENKFNEENNILHLQTPLGILKLNINFKSQSLVKVPPTESILLRSGAIISSWHHEDNEIQLLKMKISPKLPKSMKIEECFAFLWRVSPTKQDMRFDFECRLQKISDGIDLNPETGEGLIAQTGFFESYKLTIGTEDDDYLQQRALTHQNMPGYLTEDLVLEIFEFLPDGLKISTYTLKKNDTMQIQFIIAMSSCVDNNDISTWYAVDQNPIAILEEAGCK